MSDLEKGNEKEIINDSNQDNLVRSTENVDFSELIDNSETRNESDDCCVNCLVLFCSLIFMFSILGGVFAYIIIGIKSLVDDYTVAHDCKGSSLWEYVLVGIIFETCSLVGGSQSNKSYNSDFDKFIFIIIFSGLANLGLGMCGGYELWDYACDNLLDTNLWTIALITFVCNVVSAFLLLVFPPILLIYISVKECYFN